MFYVTVHGHKVFPGAISACKMVFKNLIGANLLVRFEELKCENAEEVARTNYLAFMSDHLGVYLESGTPVAVVSESGEIFDLGNIPKTAPPTFESESATNIAAQAQEARKRGEPRRDHEGLNKEEAFAEKYGWLAGASNPADDAKLAEDKLMAELDR